MLERNVRTRPRSGLDAGRVLSGVLASELLNPSKELWLVSGWITDVPVIDNRGGEFDALFTGDAPAEIRFSKVLAQLVRSGTGLRLALRTDPHNEAFLARLTQECGSDEFLRFESVDLHEKTMCGEDWVMQGSMNFTWRGLNVNEENIQLRIDPVWAASQRVELQQRWNAGEL